jgi:alkylation response protein AidB-like acyl-CoA dehydrogenase
VSIGANPITIQAGALVAIVAKYELPDGATRSVGELLIEEAALDALLVKGASRAVASSQLGPEGNLGKLVAAEHSQRVTEFGLDILGPTALLGDEPELVHDYLFSRCLTIAGGTSEILRTQIAERLLGLPREPKVEPLRPA